MALNNLRWGWNSLDDNVCSEEEVKMQLSLSLVSWYMFIFYSTHANPFRRHIGQMNILESIEQVTLRCCVCSRTSLVHTLHLPLLNTVQYFLVSCDIFMILGHRDRQKTVIKVVFRSNESYRMILFRYVTSHLQETIQAEGKHFSQLKLMAN